MAAVSTIVAGTSAALSYSAAQSQADATRRAADEQKRTYENAQELLQKNKDEAITDIDIAELKSKGLIDEAAEAQLQEIMAGGEEYVQQLIEGKGEFFSGVDQLQKELVDDIMTSGALTREDIEAGALKAIEELAPWSDAGKRALKAEQILLGIASDAEVSEFAEKYGDPREELSSEQESAEQALDRRQRALGIRYSGVGLEQFGRLNADLERRKLEDIKGLSAKGLQAATNIAGIQERKGYALGNQRQGELSSITGVKSTLGQSKLQMGAQTSDKIANMKLGIRETMGKIKSSRKMAQANLVQQSAQQRSNVRVGVAGQTANLGALQADSLFNSSKAVSEAERQRNEIFPTLIRDYGKEYKSNANVSKSLLSGGKL